MSTTPHLTLTLIEQSQAQKEVTVNQALTQIDAMLNTGAKSMALSAPPSSPSAGDVYIVAAGPTGAWAGQAGNIAYFSQVWNFIVPNQGMNLWVNNLGIFYVYNGTAWVADAGVSGPGVSVDGEIALFSGTTGAVVKRAAGTGFVKSTSGVFSTETSVNLGSDVSGTLPATAVQSGVFCQSANNLSDVANAATARLNLLSVNSISTAATLASSAFGQVTRCTGASAYTVTLPAHSAGKILEFTFQTSSGALVTLSPPSGAIDGQSVKIYGAYESCVLYDDGANYFTLRERLQPVSFFVNAAATSIASSTPTKITFNAVVFDTGGFYDAAVNYRYTPQYPGKYAINASLAYNGVGANAEFDTRIYKSGTQQLLGFINTTAAFTSDSVVTAGDILQLNGSTDYVEVWGFQNSGSAVNTQASAVSVYFSGHRISNF